MPKQFLDPQGLSQFTENLEQSIVADKYSSSSAYAVGNYCIHENLLYRCTTAIPSGESWNSSHWVQILIMGELSNLNREATTTTPGLMSATDKVKLNGIESGAEVNVQSDWNAVSGDALILNKPTLGEASSKGVSTTVTSGDPNLVTSGAVYTAIDNIPDNDTWRNIKVNGAEKLSTDISSGAVDFVNGTNTTVSFNSTGNKVAYDVPVVSVSSAGVAPQGESVSDFDQTSKFLRSDGSWVAPKYTEDTWRPITVDGQSTSGRALHIDAGTNITITQTATGSSQTATINATDTNTTYTFADGTNGFTVTPSDGTAQTVTVTPDLQLEGTASGSIASFDNGGDNIPVKSLVAGIVASQDGSGTPSPSNVRAISGFDNVEIVVTGKNAYSKTLVVGQRANASTGNIESYTNAACTDYIPIKGGVDYILSGLMNGLNDYISFYDQNKVYISRTSSGERTQRDFTTPNNACYCILTFVQVAGQTTDINTVLSLTPQLELGTTATTYAQYKGTTYIIALGQTIYGGTLHVTTGVLTVTHGFISDLSDNDWILFDADNHIFRTSVSDIKSPTNNAERNKGIICSCYKPSEGVLINNTMDNEGMLKRPYLLYVRDNAYSDATTFQSSLSGQQFAYELATPIRINLTKTQVTTLLNENNIYANSGDISVVYFTQSAKNISDVANSSNKMDFSNPTGTGALSIGRKSGTTTGSQSMAVGYDVEASGARSVALGHATTATGDNGSFAEGYQSKASGTYGAHSEGRNTEAKGTSSHAEGYGSIAEGSTSHAEGINTKAEGAYSHAEGFGTLSNHRSQHTFGEYNLADTSSAATNVRGTYIEIVGKGSSDANRSNARTLDWNGNETLAGDLTINGSTSVGSTLGAKMDKANPTGTGALSLNRASGSTVGANSVAVGNGNIASGEASFAEGRANTASGIRSHAEGSSNTASGDYSHVEGAGSTSSGARSHAEGSETIASGAYSHAEGYSTQAVGSASHAEGYSTITNAINSHVEGNSNTINILEGQASNGCHAEGMQNTISGNAAHAEGRNNTVTNANYAHVEGYQNTITGGGGHVEGYGNTASGQFCHIDGRGGIANHRAQHVFGEYNVADTSTAAFDSRGNYLEIVGKGTSDANRSNARTLDWSGNETLAGGLKLHENQDAATLTVSSSIAAGATYDFTNFSDGAVIFVYRPSDSGQSDYTGIYIRAGNWQRLIPIKEAPNVTINGYVLTNGNTQGLRCAIIST